MEIINFKSLQQIKDQICQGKKTLYVGSQTSTVIPYNTSQLASETDYLGNLASLDIHMEIDDKGNLSITGPASWLDAKNFCLSNGRKIMTSPTEELALCLSGIATSATGERCFRFGTLREQLIQITYLDYQGYEKTLHSDKSISELALFQGSKNAETLHKYQESYSQYKRFKNAPFPRFEKETDLMVGTEGQLGVITSAVFKTTEANQEMYIFIRLPRWEEDHAPHLELFEKVQGFRDIVDSCELIDENSLSYLPEELRPQGKGDLVFLEVDHENMDRLYEELITKLDLISEDDIFEMNSSKCRELRMNVPRYIFEKNQQMGVVKMGTDVQVSPEKFERLLQRYREWIDIGIDYNLFGHFGDAHLHFNFMPTTADVNKCQELLNEFYNDVKEMQGSPFAEHGIGLIKQKFIRPYYNDVHLEMFQLLKSHLDPNNVFFPNGFMSAGV